MWRGVATLPTYYPLPRECLAETKRACASPLGAGPKQWLTELWGSPLLSAMQPCHKQRAQSLCPPPAPTAFLKAALGGFLALPGIFGVLEALLTGFASGARWLALLREAGGRNCPGGAGTFTRRCGCLRAPAGRSMRADGCAFDERPFVMLDPAVLDLTSGSLTKTSITPSRNEMCLFLARPPSGIPPR